MRALVTGAASFIGGHLTEALLRRGDTVVAVDGISDYYPAPIKKRNLAEVGSGLEPIEADLATADVVPLLDGVDVVFHLAGQPGVRASWGTGFAPYVQANIVATQRLLEACRTSRVTRFVNSSSSSVYGSATRFPTNEEDPTRPFSPYGVTKLAAEHLCSLYADNWGLPVVSLRYLTVYGPRQRPILALHRMIEAAFDREPLPLYGDGRQIRDFTYVADAVAANLSAAAANVVAGGVHNIGGGSATSVLELLDRVGDPMGNGA